MPFENQVHAIGSEYQTQILIAICRSAGIGRDRIDWNCLPEEAFRHSYRFSSDARINADNEKSSPAGSCRSQDPKEHGRALQGTDRLGLETVFEVRLY